MDPIICWMLCIIFYSIGQVNAQSCQTPPDMEKLSFEAVDTNQNMSLETKDWGSMSPLFRMSNLFLDAVQQNKFPEDILREAITNRSSLQMSRVVKYEAGYVVCAVIAILFIIFILVFGIIFCTYQHRGKRIFSNCNGPLSQRTPIFLGLIITCYILFAGLVCSFYLNETVHQEVGPGARDVQQSLQDFRRSINGIPLALEKVASQFRVPKQKVFDALENFVPTAERMVTSKLDNDIIPLLSDTLATAKRLEAATQNIVVVNRTMTNVLERQAKLLLELKTHRENLYAILSDPLCTNCSEAANTTIEELQLGLNYSQMPSVREYVKNLNNVRKVNLTGIIRQGMQAMNGATKSVNTQTIKTVKESKDALERTEQEISLYVSNLPIQRYIAPINRVLVERYEYYRWVIGIVLCSVVLVILTCTILGLSVGIFGLYTRQDPSAATARQRTGSMLLLVEVYLSFFFSVLLIIFVFIIFLVGGNVQTLVCRHWASGDIYRFLDNPRNLPSNLNLKKLIGLREDSNLSDLYQECSRGAPIWDVLQFNATIDLDSTLNISKYTGDLESKIDSVPVGLDGLDLFAQISILVLSDYKKSGLDRVPTSSMMAQLEAPLLKVDLAQFVSALERLASIQEDPKIRSQLQNETASLKSFQSSTLRDQEEETRKLNESLKSLGELILPLQTGIDRAIQNVQTLHGPLITDFIESLKHESRCVLSQSIEFFSQYADWVKKTVIEDIASCRAVPRTLDRVRVIVCHNVTQPWNGFWFCLGWCTLCLIPNILISIKSSELIEPRSRLFLTM
uniref:Prominin 2 n=1 Tax=Leptobrachium leishanense TaxID=445787 RepID=A0A8C5M9N2_9ANUR